MMTNSMQRLLWLGPLTVIGSLAAVLLVRLLAVMTLHPAPGFLPLTLTPVMVDTTVLVTVAVIVFYRVTVDGVVPGPFRMLAGRYAFQVDRVGLYRLIAFRVLLISFIPDIAIVVRQPEQLASALALAVMHVVAWAVSVGSLTLFVDRRP